MNSKEGVIKNSRNLGDEILHIITDMNFKRWRWRSMGSEEIHQKLFSLDPEKIGEYFEFMEEYEVSDGRLTPDLALEIADIVYHTSQPNCTKEDRMLATKIEEMVGIDHKLAQQFCILKYSYRAYEQTDRDDYKVVERDKMAMFLKNTYLGILE